MPFRRWLLAACLIGSSTAVGRAQVAWREHLSFLPRERHTMVFDSARNVVVLFGGFAPTFESNHLSEWDGTRWSHRQPAVRPPARRDHAMAYDSARQRVVVFGGYGGGGTLNDTWEWDGSSWRQLQPASSPPPRTEHAMVYDAARRHCVMFSGYHLQSNQNLTDTWTWDGTNWQQLPVVGPPGRSDFPMVYDTRRNRVVLFGGTQGFLQDFGDCWEWDGTRWAQNLSTAPPARFAAMMYFDTSANRAILYGGADGIGLVPRGDMWTFDGATWTQMSPPVTPGLLRNSAAAYDAARGRGVLACGDGGPTGASSDTWTFDGATWQRTSAITPSGRSGHVMDFDGVGVVLFGGFDRQDRQDTWRFADDVWTELRPAVAPPARCDAAVAWDAARRRLVMFGGKDATNAVRADTWEWDGSQWTLRTPPVSPPARSEATMAYDPVQRQVLLRGGTDGAYVLNDLWSYDGNTWRLLSVTGPGGRGRIAYDDNRDALVFKGLGLFGVGSTWQWDRVRWTQLTPPTEPPVPVWGAALVRDSARGRLVLSMTVGYWFDSWEWDGSTWSQRLPWSVAPPLRFDPVTAYDPSRGITVMFGGSGNGDTWIYGPTRPASFTTHYASCPASTGLPRLDSNGARPWLGDTFTIRVANLPPTAPCVLLLGESATSLAGAIPLPLELSPLGMRGCWLYTDIAATVPMANTNGVATWSTRIAGLPLGQRFYCQGLFADPLANPAGLGTTNAAVAVVGGR